MHACPPIRISNQKSPNRQITKSPITKSLNSRERHHENNSFPCCCSLSCSSPLRQPRHPQRREPANRRQPPTFTKILDRSLNDVEGEFVPAAEAMPEDKYSFAPTNGEFKGVRNFGQQVRHVAAANYMICAAILA